MLKKKKILYKSILKYKLSDKVELAYQEMHCGVLLNSV